MSVNIFNNDCLIEMDNLEDNSVDLVICDLPYGVTKAEHDVIIPMNDFVTEVVRGKPTHITLDEFLIKSFKKGITYKESLNYFNENKEEGLWTKYHRVVKENGAIVLTAKVKFLFALVNSNLKDYRYEWIWNKRKGSNFAHVKKMPLNVHEYVVVFYKKLPTYNPQMTEGKPYTQKRKQESVKGIADNLGRYTTVSNGLRYPKTIIEVDGIAQRDIIHPTQKPVSLFEYLIKTYTNENDIVLDNCMGSGTTAIACINTNRNFIGFEKDETYYKLALDRIEKHK